MYRALRSSMVCIVCAALIEGTIVDVMFSVRSWLGAGTVVLLAGQFHAEALQDCISLYDSSLPRSIHLIEALKQPLAATGPGSLERWLSMVFLAQAVAHRRQGCCVGGMQTVVGRTSPVTRLLPFATDMFCHERNVGQGPDLNSYGLSGADGKFPSAAPLRGSFFATYSRSSLEVIREFTTRVECLDKVLRHPTPSDPTLLHPIQHATLESEVVELGSLVRVAIAGLTGWVCLSRELDRAGIVQREDGLRCLIYELCGVLCAAENLGSLNAANISCHCIQSIQESENEARHSLEQLLLTFEGAGLREVRLPPSYRQFVGNLGF